MVSISRHLHVVHPCGHACIPKTARVHVCVLIFLSSHHQQVFQWWKNCITNVTLSYTMGNSSERVECNLERLFVTACRCLHNNTWNTEGGGYGEFEKGQRSGGSKVNSSKSIMRWREGWVGRYRYPWGLQMMACWWWIELEGIGGGFGRVGRRVCVWTWSTLPWKMRLCLFPPTRVCVYVEVCVSSVWWPPDLRIVPRAWCLSIQTARGGGAGPRSTPEPIPEDS